MMYTLISKFAIIPSKKQIVKIRKIEADSDSDRDENNTCSKLQKKSIALYNCSLHVIHPQLQSEIPYILLYLCSWSSEVKYRCRCNKILLCTSKYLTKNRRILSAAGRVA